MSKIFFTADTHFGHGNIIKYCHRPFLTDRDKEELASRNGKWHIGDWKGDSASSWRISRDAVDMMNDDITDNINEMVGQDDILWHLGDFAFARKDDYYRKCRFYRDRIICQNINIIWGNHDHPDKIRDLFNESHTLHEIRAPKSPGGLKVNIVLCHYAMAVWNKSHRGNLHLYGHSHTTAEPGLDSHFPDRRSMDVGVDNAAKLFGKYRPFSMDEIQNLLMKRLGHRLDHHCPRNSKAPTEEELL